MKKTLFVAGQVRETTPEYTDDYQKLDFEDLDGVAGGAGIKFTYRGARYKVGQYVMVEGYINF